MTTHAAKDGDMSLNPDEIRQILTALDESDWDEALITVGDTSITVTRNGAPLTIVGDSSAPTRSSEPPAGQPPVAAPEPMPSVEAARPEPAPIPAPAVAPGGSADTRSTLANVTSPTVGIFWRSPQPGTPPFVQVGDTVAEGDVLCIVEVMKLMSNVASPVAGTVVEVLVDNSAAVEFGQILFTIDPVR